MLNKKMRTVLLILTITAFASSQTDILGTLKQKLTRSRPSYSQIYKSRLFSTSARRVSKRYYAKIHLSELSSYINKSERSITSYNFKPYKHFEVLRFGTKYEMYGFGTNIKTGGSSNSIIHGMLGQRTGEEIEMIYVIGTASATTKQLYNRVKYKKCSRFLFFKSCRTKYKDVPRGYQNSEILQIGSYLRNQAHTSAISKLASKLEISEDLEDFMLDGAKARSVKPRRQVLYGVLPGDAVFSVGSMVGGNVEKFEGKILGFVNNGKNGNLKINVGGVWRIEFLRQGDGRYQLTISY